VTTAEANIDVASDITTVYNQWTQFEDFPLFMEGVDQVTQLDDRHLHWKVSIAGVHREFDATITEQIPDVRVAWKADGEVRHAGVVDFHRIEDRRTGVSLQLDMDPQGLVEHVGDALGVVERRAKGDLKRFRLLVEKNQEPTGSWRGEVPREG
jgi:uncharacterized membrane protein